MEKPRSIYIAFDVFPRHKGSSSHIASMAAALARRHAPVLLLCLGYGDMPSAQFEDGVTIRRYKMYHPNMLRRAVGFMDFVGENVAAAGGAAELIVFRDPWGGCPALCSAGRTAATVFEVNALPRWELAYTYPAVKNNFALLAKLEDMDRDCLARCDRIITVSSLTAESLVRAGAAAGKISVIPNAASAEYFHSRAEDCPLPELRNGRWFGYAGSLHPWQGIDTAVEAFGMIAGEAPDANMLIVHNGKKDALKQLRRLIRKRSLTGRILLQAPMPPEQLAAVLSALTFTVVPLAETERNTVQGCCPVKLVESLAAGTPVIASNMRVCRELVTHEINSLLALPDSPRAWALAMETMFNEPGLAERLSLAAGATASECFSTSVIHEKLEHSFGLAARSKQDAESVAATGYM